MKKTIVIITAIWIISLVAIVAINPNNSFYNKFYKITINRIQQSLTEEFEKNLLIIESLSDEELGPIETIEIVEQLDSEIEDIWNGPIVYMQIEGTNYLAKYSMVPMKSRQLEEKLIVALIVTLAYLLVLINIYILYRNIIKPMEKISGMTKQLASGNIVEINFLYKNSYFKDVIWGLDMLREQLVYERDKNRELEKDRKTLVASLSHDIKTPLSSVKNYTIALEENVYESEEDKNKAFKIILDNVEVIDKLTKELLESSSHAMKEIKIQSKEVYLKEVHERLNKLIHHKIDLLHMDYIEHHIEENLMLIVDMDRLLEVFGNLIENALKYGDIKNLSVKYSTEENYVLIEIHNTGKPIPETELKHIFTSYYRGSNVSDKPGYGLGLYISKQIMKSMQGDIFIKNTTTGVSAVVVIKQAG